MTRLPLLLGIATTAGVIAIAPVADAALLDDAKNLLSRLNDAGDYGRASAENAVRQAREAAERGARGKYADGQRRLQDVGRKLADAETQRQKLRDTGQAMRDKDPRRLEADLDVARRQVGEFDRRAAANGRLTPQERTQLETARTNVAGLQRELAAARGRPDAKLTVDNTKIDAQMKEAREKYEQAMAAATAEMVSAIVSGLASLSGGAIDASVGEGRQQVGSARDALRALIPSPTGTRVAVRIERRCVTVGTVQQCSNVEVPNNPSDGDLRGAINAGNAALSTVGRAGERAAARFQVAQSGNVDLQAALQRLNQFLAMVSNAEKAYDDTARAIITNLRG
jgi:hypothetical protein